MVRLDQLEEAVKLTKDRPTRRFDRVPDADMRHKLQKIVVEIKVPRLKLWVAQGIIGSHERRWWAATT
jgi:hypothetical protein